MAVVHVIQNEAAPVIRELLEAAEKLGLPASVVATSSDGVYGFSLIVPDEVYELSKGEPEPQAESEPKPKNKGGRPKKAVPPAPEEEE